MKKMIKIFVNGKLNKKYPIEQYYLAIEHAKILAHKGMYNCFKNQIKIICPLPEDFPVYGTKGTN